MRVCLLLCLCAAAPAAAQPTLTVLSSNATKALIEELGPEFQKTTGQKVTVVYDNSAALKTRIGNGAAFDVIVATASVVSDLGAGARRFIAFLSGPQAAPVIVKKGMEPIRPNRLPPISVAEMTPAQREAVDAFKTARNAEVTGPFHPLLRSPELMTRTRAMGDYLRYKSALPPRLSEFVILMTARAWTQQYEWNAHYPIAVKAGLKAEIADAIAEGRRPANMSEEEATLYDFCQELHRDKSVSDATYARAVKAFGEQGVVDTIGISGYYTMLAMVLNIARTPPGASGAPTLRPLPQ